MRIFITGGTGFVGKPTITMLRKRGHSILLLSRSARKAPGVKVIKGDLADITKWKKQLKAFKPDAAIHLAWEGIPDFSAAMCAKNLSNSIALFMELGDIGCKKVVVTGTCFEYITATGKLHEDRPIQPQNMFPASKHALHVMGSQIAKEKKMQFVWARPFYIYGVGQRSGSLIPYIIQCAKSDTPPTLKSPFARNDFIYVDDVAAALVRLAEAPLKDMDATYNIGSGTLTSVADIVKKVYDALDKEAPRFGKKETPPGFWADGARINKDTGWKPQIGIAEGIKKMLNDSK